MTDIKQDWLLEGLCKDGIYDNIYSPVAKMTIVRTLLIVGIQFKYNFQQLYVKTAFLNGKLNEDVYTYISVPKGINCVDNSLLK